MKTTDSYASWSPTGSSTNTMFSDGVGEARIATQNTYDIEVTSFLEMVHKVDEEERGKYNLLNRLGDLLLQQFGEKIHVSEPSASDSNSVSFRTIIQLEAEDVAFLSPFLEKAEALLGDRESLKLNLRSLLSPSINEICEAESQKAVSKQLSGDLRGFMFPYLQTKIDVETPYSSSHFFERTPTDQGDNLFLRFPLETELPVSKTDPAALKQRKRGRPKKLKLANEVSNGYTEVQTSTSISTSGLGKGKPEPYVSPKPALLSTARAVLQDLGNTSLAMPPKMKVKRKVPKPKQSDLNKKPKLKPVDKAQEEAELVELGIDAIEERIANLQAQLRNVKHKHRKGTACPRCNIEQRLKSLVRAKQKASSD